MNIRVSGYIEIRPRLGDSLRTFHLVDARGVRICKCSYDKGVTDNSRRPSTKHVDMAKLTRDEDGVLHLENDEGNVVRVALCIKSNTSLALDLERLEKLTT